MAATVPARSRSRPSRAPTASMAISTNSFATMHSMRAIILRRMFRRTREMILVTPLAARFLFRASITRTGKRLFSSFPRSGGARSILQLLTFRSPPVPSAVCSLARGVSVVRERRAPSVILASHVISQLARWTVPSTPQQEFRLAEEREIPSSCPSIPMPCPFSPCFHFPTRTIPTARHGASTNLLLRQLIGGKSYLKSITTLTPNSAPRFVISTIRGARFPPYLCGLMAAATRPLRMLTGSLQPAW